MLTTDHFEEMGKNLAETIHGYYNDNSGWTVVKSAGDMLIERKSSVCEGFSNGYLYRGKCVYACPKETVYRYVDPQSGDCLRKKWDVDMKDIETLKTITPNMRIVRTYTNSAAMGLIAPRDFTDLLVIDRADNFVANAGQSIVSDEWPPVPKFVRGFNYPCGFMCRDIPGKANATQLISFIQPDIKGSLPSSLVHSAIPNSMVGFFTNLGKCLKKDGHISK